MPKFPLHFNAEAQAEFGISTHWDCSSEKLPKIKCSIPAEFSGPGGGYSPEDLFGHALINCLIATFKVYTEKSGLSFSNLKVKADIKMDIDPSTNKMAITEIHTDINIQGASNPEKIRAVLDKSIADCAISNSIKSGKNFTINIS